MAQVMKVKTEENIPVLSGRLVIHITLCLSQDSFLEMQQPDD